MNTDEATMKMKAKLNAFFDRATQQDISALLERTNYEFYKDVKAPGETWFEVDLDSMKEGHILTIPVMSTLHHAVPNRPVTYVGRGYNLAADHQDLALAA